MTNLNFARTVAPGLLSECLPVLGSAATRARTSPEKVSTGNRQARQEMGVPPPSFGGAFPHFDGQNGSSAPRPCHLITS